MADGFDPSEYGNTEEDSATEKKRERDRRLREAGLPVERSKSDLLSEIDELLLGARADSSDAAEKLFAEGLTQTGGDPFKAFEAANERGKSIEISPELGSLLDEYGQRFLSDDGGGRVFRPSVMNEPSESDLFNATENAALGPAPDLVFRDVFEENFGDFTKMSGPYDKFVAKQSKELEQRFLTDVFAEFNQEGFQDQLRADYESLYRTKERGDFDGAGGSIPAFEDFIKQRVKGNFRTFLEGEKPKLQQAFQLASPDERGQRDAGNIAPMRRIL